MPSDPFDQGKRQLVCKPRAEVGPLNVGERMREGLCGRIRHSACETISHESGTSSLGVDLREHEVKGNPEFLGAMDMREARWVSNDGICNERPAASRLHT